MGFGDAFILGIVQGLTEFLPVSSSGHLVLGKALLGIPEQGIAFEVFVHFGTLLAVLTSFRHDVAELVKAFFSIFRKSTREAGLKSKYHEDSVLRLLVYIVVATIPAVIVGLWFEEPIETAFNSPRLVGITLMITGLILLATRFIARAAANLTLRNTFIMGLAQAMAILPGISRSGSTISVGLFQKVSGDEAARFSFLLAIPAILGATLLKTLDLIETGLSTDFLLVLLIGTITSYVSGYIAIESLLRVVRRGKLYLFAPYCFLVGLIALVFI